MGKLAVYGPHTGHSSIEVVTRGVEQAAEHHGVLGGVRTLETQADFLDSEPGGWFGTHAALNCDAYTMAPIMEQGHHRRRFQYIFPNSTWVPQSFYIVCMNSSVDCVLTCSDWAVSMLKGAAPEIFSVRIRKLRLGVDSERFRRWDVDQDGVVRDPRNERYVVSHFAGSALERKGTLELLEAFCRWDNPDAVLALVVHPMEYTRVREARDEKPERFRETIGIWTRVNGSPEVMRTLYWCSDLVVQPSRAESYGFIPIEARCCGVPVAITTETGHREYCFEPTFYDNGMVAIPTRVDAEVAYDPGGHAPDVHPDDIAHALDLSYENREMLKQEAEDTADEVRRQHDWATAMKWFMEGVRDDRL